MKLLISFIVFLFIAFLSIPTIVGMMDENADTSCFYSMCEEEENDVSYNDMNWIPLNPYTFLNVELEETHSISICKGLLLPYFNLAHQIFAPPPNIL